LSGVSEGKARPAEATPGVFGKKRRRDNPHFLDGRSEKHLNRGAIDS